MVVIWPEDAACYGMAPQFDEDSMYREAFLVCFRCPVIDACYDTMMRRSRDNDYGLWGGLGRFQRLRIRERRSTREIEFRKNVEQFVGV